MQVLALIAEDKTGAKVTLSEDNTAETAMLDLLFSSGSENGEEIRQVQITDQRSNPRHAKVDLQEIPSVGVNDSGADITVVGGDLFKCVAVATRRT